MHSSRMRTIRSSGHISGGYLVPGGVYLVLGGCLPRGVYLVLGGVPAPRGCLLLRGLHLLRYFPLWTDRRL